MGTVQMSSCLTDLDLPKLVKQGSGCGAVGRAVASYTRGPRFESSHRQKFIEHLFTVNCIEKTKIKKKEAGNGPFFFKKREWNQSMEHLN